MKHAMAIALLAIVSVGCGQEEAEAYQARSLDEMLSYGANHVLIDRYESTGLETDAVLGMLEAVGRDGSDRHPDYVQDLVARGFELERTDATNSITRYLVKRKAM